MSSTVQLKRPAQRPALPWEVTDIIIDHLFYDVRALGTCGAVCTEWLARSRFHLFSTVQLCPWRLSEFVRIANGEDCTFSGHVRRVEVDDLRERKQRERRGGAVRHLGRKGPTVPVVFAEAMNLKCLAKAEELQIRNIDWTLLPLAERTAFRTQLAGLTRLKRFELDSVVFQDLREVARILSVLPALRHFTANVSFATYRESAGHGVSCIVPSLELGTDDAIPVLLGATGGRALRGRPGTHLETLAIHLKKVVITEGDLAAALDLSALRALRTLCIGGLSLESRDVLERALPRILGCVEAPFLESIELQFHSESGQQAVDSDWGRLQSVLLELHFFGMSAVRVYCALGADSPLDEREVERCVRAGMREIDARRALVVRVGRTKAEQRNQVYDSLCFEDYKT
ncbi:hypothetical protein HYPSUDRAFT_217406 [Hypholoma sublateritium FD-334 SS-4]|uniref:F-box domain-containing protein n=1 Tax=Hypholoma sublateritium (strain FD-334 SS-4) TaxID=945553 RepID=A0A0D2KZB4_HYPSF|nr:hypothetical protein HYPSUDRAFT_217406 [Hypholoma sublateritium FD-334 SS-4]